MEPIGKTVGVVTPVKDSHGSRSKNQEASRRSENANPNFSPGQKSPIPVKSAKSQKSAARHNPNPNPDRAAAYSPRKKIRERKFVVAKRKARPDDAGPGGGRAACKCDDKVGLKKCLCVAYENLRASQEEFFKSRDEPKLADRAEVELEVEIEKGLMIQDLQVEESESKIDMGHGDPIETVSSTVKRRRAKLMKEARKSTPGYGKVMHLVKAFEKLSTIPISKESDEQKSDEEDEANANEEDFKKGLKWALPGLQAPSVPDSQFLPDTLCPSDLVLTSENLGLDPRASISSSWDGSSGSVYSRNSSGGRRSRRNSSESAFTVGGSRWNKKKLRSTSQKPFKLRTEQRGRVKEEEFVKKLQEMIQEEEKQRIPIAQGLPWTTDEPECLIKPAVKGSTRPLDLMLHSDVRAVERAEFDHQVTEKMTLIEMYKTDKERRQKLEEEEEIRRLRKELVPKAQPMPYFDRPFFPRRSEKLPTIPKEPKFHVPQQKKIRCYASWSDVSSYTCQD